MKMSRFALLFPVLLWCSTLFGQEPPAPAPASEPVATEPVATPTDTEKDKAAYVELVDGEVKVKDVVADGTEVYDAVMAYRQAKQSGDTTGIALIIAAGLAALFKILLSVAKMLSKVFFSTGKGKMVLRVITLVLGLAVFFTVKFAAGFGWVDAIIAALSGPGAIVVHELLDLFAGAKDDKPATT